MQILPFWLMKIFKALKAFYFLTNMTWEVFGMSGKFKLFQWWSQVVEFDTKHLNVVGISFAQVCLSLPHSNLPNKGSWAPRARGYSCAQALPLCSSTSRRRCALCGARGLLFHSALARFWPSRARWHKPAWPFSEDFHRIFCLLVKNTFAWNFELLLWIIMYRKSLIAGAKYMFQNVRINGQI